MRRGAAVRTTRVVVSFEWRTTPPPAGARIQPEQRGVAPSPEHSVFVGGRTRPLTAPRQQPQLPSVRATRAAAVRLDDREVARRIVRREHGHCQRPKLRAVLRRWLRKTRRQHRMRPLLPHWPTAGMARRLLPLRLGHRHRPLHVFLRILSRPLHVLLRIVSLSAQRFPDGRLSQQRLGAAGHGTWRDRAPIGQRVDRVPRLGRIRLVPATHEKHVVALQGLAARQRHPIPEVVHGVFSVVRLARRTKVVDARSRHEHNRVSYTRKPTQRGACLA
eukprot:5367980-Prymnesium_polylepis.2